MPVFDDGGWGESGDDWNLQQSDRDLGIDIKSRDYQRENLNKLSDEELARRKRMMDKDFEKNRLQPGDPGFVYDKVVDFTKKNDQASEYSEDWDV